MAAPAYLAWLLLLGAPALQTPAQSEEALWDVCADEDDKRDRGALVKACTALLERKLSKDDRRAALFNRALIYVDEEKWAEAIADLDQAIALSASGAEYWHMRGRARIGSGDLKGALLDLDRAIRLDPKDPANWNVRGDIHYDLKDYPRALKDYDRAIALRPTKAAALYYRDRADAHAALKNWTLATADFDEAIRLEPDSAPLREARAHFRYDREDYAGALADHSEAARLAADDRIDQGDALVMLDDHSGAIADYDDAIRLKPDLAEAWRSRAQAWEWLDDHAKAAADYREAARLAPKDATALSGLCLNQVLSGGDVADAIRQCDAATAVDPEFTGPFATRGLIALRQGRYEDAWKQYDQAIAPSRVDPVGGYFYGRGLAALRLGRTGPGRADMASGQLLDPSVVETYAALGFKP